MASRESKSMARQRGAIKRYYENSNPIPNAPRCPGSVIDSSQAERELLIAQTRIIQLESRVAELDAELQRLKERNQVGGEHMSDVSRERTHWKQLCDEREDIISELHQKLKTSRERAREQCKEMETERKWQQKKIKMLEQTIEKNNETRFLTQQLQQEKMNELRGCVDRLEKERQEWQSEKEQTQIDIQNLENAVKHLHDENIRLKETPIRVVIPPRQATTNSHEQTFYTYKTNGRPVAPQISLLDQMSAQRRQPQQPQPDSHSKSYSRPQSNPQSNPMPQSQWPYSASEEDLFWGR